MLPRFCSFRLYSVALLGVQQYSAVTDHGAEDISKAVSAANSELSSEVFASDASSSIQEHIGHQLLLARCYVFKPIATNRGVV